MVPSNPQPLQLHNAGISTASLPASHVSTNTACAVNPDHLSTAGNDVILSDNPLLCSRASNDLSRNVSNSWKQKIIVGEYVDLSLLLVNSQTKN